MTTYLVTGGAGFIGSNFVLYLLRQKKDIRIITLDRLTYAGSLKNLSEAAGDPRHIFVRGDICDRELTGRIFEKYDPDRVVNFAAESHVDRSIRTPEIFARTNVEGTVSLLETARKSWYDAACGTWKPEKKFLQISTDEVYGTLGKDGYFTEDSKPDPHSPYAASKASADFFAKAFYDTYGMPVCVTRCSNNFGPRQHPEKLIPLVISRALAHKTIPVYGDGLQIRDWLYVEDHCRAILKVLEAGAPGEVYNIGGHCEKTNLVLIRTLLQKLREKAGDPEIDESLIRHVADRPGHDRRYGINPSKIERESGWHPEMPFDRGIEKTVDWYLMHPDRLEEKQK